MAQRVSNELPGVDDDDDDEEEDPSPDVDVTPLDEPLDDVVITR